MNFDHFRSRYLDWFHFGTGPSRFGSCMCCSRARPLPRKWLQATLPNWTTRRKQPMRWWSELRASCVVGVSKWKPQSLRTGTRLRPRETDQDTTIADLSRPLSSRVRASPPMRRRNARFGPKCRGAKGECCRRPASTFLKQYV